MDKLFQFLIKSKLNNPDLFFKIFELYPLLRYKSPKYKARALAFFNKEQGNLNISPSNLTGSSDQNIIATTPEEKSNENIKNSSNQAEEIQKNKKTPHNNTFFSKLKIITIENYQIFLMLLPYISTILGITFHSFFKKQAESNFEFNDNSIATNKELKLIDNYFKTNQAVVVAGIQGIGKSAIITNYALENKYNYSIIWKINAENPITLQNDVKALTSFLNLQENYDENSSNFITNELNFMNQHVLLIFDKAECTNDIKKYIPDNQNIKVLIASRNFSWEVPVIHVSAFPKELSIRFLLEKLNKEDPESSEIKELVKLLEGWPIALNQCREYIYRNNLTVAQFLDLLKKKEILTTDGPLKATIDSIIGSFDENTKEVLKIIALCNSKKILEKMIEKMIDNEKVIDSKATLVNYSIIKSNNEYWNINRVVYQFISQEIDLETEKKIINYYLNYFTFNQNTIYSSKEEKKKIIDLIPHVETLVKRLNFNELNDFIILDNLISAYFNISINYNEGENSLNYLISKLRSNPIKKIDQNWVKIYKHIGDYFFLLGKYENALSQYKLIQQIIKNKNFYNDIELAKLYIKIGDCYNYLSNSNQSMSFYKKCENILINLIPLEYLNENSRFSYNNLSKNSKVLQKSSGILINNEFLITSHPDIYNSIILLGNCYKNQHNWNKALNLYEKIIELEIIAFPLNKSTIADLYNNIGECSLKLGLIRESIINYEKCKEIREEILPVNHIDLAMINNNIGDYFFSIKSFKEALIHYEKSKESIEKICPENHPQLSNIYNNLGLAHFQLGNSDNSLFYYEKCKNIREKIMSPNHYDIFSIYKNIACYYMGIGKIDDSLEYLLKCEKYLLDNGLNNAFIFNDIGNCYLTNGKIIEAKGYYDKAITVLKNNKSNKELELATIYNNKEYCEKILQKSKII